MVTTKTIWPQDAGENPNDEQRAALSAMAATLAPEQPDNLNSGLNPDGSLVIGYREWPTQEAAEQWIAYILANYNVISCAIEPQ